MNLENKLHEELMRFRSINKYGKKMITEQDAPAELPSTPMEDPLADPAGAPPPMDAPIPEMDDTEEIDITDLVNMTKSIKKDMDNKKQETDSVMNKMDDVFTKLTDLEQKLAQMDLLMDKIDGLGQKVVSLKEPTPQERLEMRSMDSYPFSQNPKQFFNDKQEEMRMSGKNEYVLTKQDVEEYPKDTIKTSFNPIQQKNEFRY